MLSLIEFVIIMLSLEVPQYIQRMNEIRGVKEDIYIDFDSLYEGYFDSTVDEEKLGYLTDVFTPISWSGGGYCYTYAGGAGSGPLVDNMQEFIVADSNGKIEVDSANFMKFTVYFNDEDKNEMKKLWIFNEEDFYYVYRKYRGKLETFRSCRWRYIYMQKI